VRVSRQLSPPHQKPPELTVSYNGYLGTSLKEMPSAIATPFPSSESAFRQLAILRILISQGASPKGSPGAPEQSSLLPGTHQAKSLPGWEVIRVPQWSQWSAASSGLSGSSENSGCCHSPQLFGSYPRVLPWLPSTRIEPSRWLLLKDSVPY